MSILRRSLLALAALLIAALIVYAYWPKPLPVPVTIASRGPMDVTITEEGKTRIHDCYTITAPVASYAPRLDWHPDDSVTAGQTLLVLAPLPSSVLDARARAEAQARVAQARAALDAAQTNAQAVAADAELAAREAKRLQALFDTGAVSQTVLDAAEARARSTRASLQSARSAIEVARYELQAAETALKYSTGRPETQSEAIPLTAPIDGRVLNVAHENEGVVQAGQAILTIGDPASLEVEIDVLSADAVRIQPGTRVEFERWGGPAPLQGRVRTVEPAAFTKVSALGVEEQRVLVIADITSPREEWKHLGHAYRVDARFLLWHGDKVLRVPVSALFRNGGQWQVLALEDGRIVAKTLDIGERGDRYAQVLKGLDAGAAVITYPDDSMSIGARAEAREQSTE